MTNLAQKDVTQLLATGAITEAEVKASGFHIDAVAVAKARYQILRGDAAWRNRWEAGDTECRKELDQINLVISQPERYAAPPVNEKLQAAKADLTSFKSDPVKVEAYLAGDVSASEEMARIHERLAE